MQLAAFTATCPYEIGDKVKGHTITDIVCSHYLKTGRVEFLYELDNSGKLAYIVPTQKTEERK